MRHESPAELRSMFRAGRSAGQTSALAPGFAQANLAILPKPMADAFEAYLHANPAPCPLLARGRTGDPTLAALGSDIDLRFDLPRYRILRDGMPAETVTDIADLWRDDLVAFAVGCSLSFEDDLVAGGVALRCHAPGVSCSAFDSDLPTQASGLFAATLVVTMRAIRDDDVGLAIEITRNHPSAHGAPVHVGDPAQIGVDLARPIDGIGLTDIRDGEVPVFWACGVTMERAIAAARLPLAITHAPGHMLITDLPAGNRAHSTTSKWEL